ncbi:helix-turn-helix domain-containing protein [Vibrio alginolyticus]|uniref:helix-turn-helix domain-containing protein n=1 Tax=Vibrio sp. B1FLJ16 TaxID=2751178 RepID=UPI0015F60142|nr:helix-turn-helix domain-containing protein [Vibrio sp. B1FLJ16]CAD7817790.1 arabinose operon control protein [Vibrio sp. B1FLJ16]CAE6932320.1 arabinose operon control protein [Vibrio sp. B1FLJ16]
MVNDGTCHIAPHLCTHPTKDANQQAASLVNWQQEYDQISNGRFLGQIRERRFSSVHVFREDSNRALKQQCRVEEGGVWLGISVENKSLHINHSQLGADKLLVRQGGVDFELITPEAFSIYGMVLKQDFVQQLKEQLELDDFKGQELYLSGLNEHHIRQLKYYLGILLEPSQTRWSCETHQSVVKDVLTELFSLNLQTSSSSPLKATPNAGNQRQVVMNRVQQYLENQDYRSPITVTELCDAVHVSRRTLQYTFEACCDTSPKQFIQRMRLNQVRRTLQDPQDSRNIAEIAFDFGFFHLGQFGQSYRKLFGESPTETRQKI